VMTSSFSSCPSFSFSHHHHQNRNHHYFPLRCPIKIK
jgi:hypothetical protein